MKLSTLFLVGAGLISLPAMAQSTETLNPIDKLNEEIAAMHSLEPYLEQEDLNQIRMYEGYTHLVVDSLAQNGMGHVKTFEAFQDQIIGMDSGAFFFEKLSQQSWGKQAALEIKSVQDLMVSTYGYNRHAYDHALLRILTQIDRQCTALKKLSAPHSVLAMLDTQSLQRAMAIVSASTGSRPKAFAAAFPIARTIKSLYPELEKIPSTDRDLYNAALTLRFFNERLIDYAQFESL